MAQASRALAHVTRLHGFTVRETHPPFGAEAFTQSGHALPASTQRATLGNRCDPGRCGAGASARGRGVRARPPLAGRSRRLRDAGRDHVRQPDRRRACGGDPGACVRARPLEPGRVASVGGDADWRVVVRARPRTGRRLLRGAGRRAGDAGPCLRARALRRRRDAGAVCGAPRGRHRQRLAAPGRRHRAPRAQRPGRLRPDPRRRGGDRRPGRRQPAPMLLAAALMLGEGLGERRAPRRSPARCWRRPAMVP